MKRIQRQRTKGWRMPDGAVYVGRPTKWGNPWRIAEGGYMTLTTRRRLATEAFREWLVDGKRYWFGPESEARAAAIRDSLPALRGHDLVCWCPLDQPCHADVLLELAS